MSVRVLSLVWLAYSVGGSDLLALLALADSADDSGRSVAGEEHIAAKLRVSENKARQILRRLTDAGYVNAVKESADAGAQQGFQINLTRLAAARGRS